MHLPDGLVPLPLVVAGYGLSAAITWVIVRRLEQAPTVYMPRAALMTAGFFIGSWIHIPVPPSSVHLVLSGLMGALLGLYAWPAILVGLFFQAVMFGHGGLSTLGLNSLVLGLPALVAAVIFRWRRTPRGTALRGFLAGAIATGLVALLFFGFAMAAITGPFGAGLDVAIERRAIGLIVLAHGPLMLIEGTLTAAVVTYLQRAYPQLLEAF